MRAHEAGALHADGYGGPPLWLPTPTDVNELMPQLWPAGVSRDDQGRLSVAGIDAVSIADEFGTPVYVVDEADFRARARAYKLAFDTAFPEGGAFVYYAGKAFLCTAVARWVMEEGLGLDVCSGGELAVAQRVGFPPERIEMHGNNKSAAEIESALAYGVGRIVVDSFDEIERVDEIAGRLGVVAPVMVRVTVGVEAHTHEYIATAHEDQKFGFSLAGRVAHKAIAEVLARPNLELVGLHSHIGSQIFETDGFDVAARRLMGLFAETGAATGERLPELDLGGGFGIAYTAADSPAPVEDLARGLAEIIEHECRGFGLSVPALSVEPGRAISGPPGMALYRVGTVKRVEIGGGQTRRYISVDGGMSDNIRPALYAAEYSAALANRTSEAPPVLSRVVGLHCEGGDILVRDVFLPDDVRPGDLLAVPASGAYSRSMASNYNHTPRPPMVGVSEGRLSVLVRRETLDDLLALDAGLDSNPEGQ